MQVETLSLQGRLTKQASLASYNSWKVGGFADVIYIPSGNEDLAVFLKQLPAHTPIFWLGLGSNVLIRDGGVSGVVIVTQGGLDNISVIDEKECLIKVEAGVSCAKAARFSARLGMTGIEFLAGIPGTVGGALAMNAGCYGGETWQHIEKVELINRRGQRLNKQRADFMVGYRSVELINDSWFTAGYFKLNKGERARSLEDIRVLLEKRNASQPTGLPNCGSVFRNPPGYYAAKLIEDSGLKGFKIGGASISEKHANFIINDGDAKASDIEKLINYIIEKVVQKNNITLIPEVCFVGKES
ncbi:UDP-N-acetylmuramate dehydrogenase [Gammaproteobacteria bacterium]|nr:UDP-N-acetylmuramate dehydrogenase [Gammaproteobacteria bacterium]